MPTYAYACKDCDHAFDIVQSFSDDSLTECPGCTGTLRKKFGSIGVTFKGSGFYRTDSRSSSSSSAQGSNSSSSADSSSSTSSSNGSNGSDSSTTSNSSKVTASASSSAASD